jgi:hypothetical protein
LFGAQLILLMERNYPSIKPFKGYKKITLMFKSKSPRLVWKGNNKGGIVRFKRRLSYFIGETWRVSKTRQVSIDRRGDLVCITLIHCTIYL